MYLMTTIVATAISVVLWIFFKDRKGLHLDILSVIFGAASLMWLIDSFYSLASEGVFVSFTDSKDGWIALFTLIGGLFAWLLLSFILNNSAKSSNK